MDKNKNCSVCNIKEDRNNYNKYRSICKDCYNTKKRKYKIKPLIQNPHTISDNDNTSRNNRTFLVGPSFSVKAYLMLKNLSRIPDRDI